ncbi:mechanosensitive ion channel [bacterium]|nr:mechanosensitive ion channel [bacterium]
MSKRVRTWFRPLFCLLIALAVCGPIARSRTHAQAEAKKAHDRPTEVPQNGPSKSQLIAELRSQIDSDQAQLEQLRKDLTDSSANPESAFSKAETRFKSIENSLKEARKKVADLRSQDTLDTEAVSAGEHEVEELEVKRKEALSDFELEIDQNKVLQEKIVTIELKIDSGKVALDRLMNPGVTEKKQTTEKESPKTAQNPPASGQEAAKSGESKAVSESKQAKVAGIDVKTASGIATGNPALISGMNTESKDPSARSEGESDSVIARRIREQIREQRKIIEDSQARLIEAEKDEEILTAMVANLERQVQLESKLRDNARKKADLANGKLSKAQEEFRVKSIADAPQDLLQEMADKLLEMDKDFQSARDESRLHSNRLEDIQNERAAKQELLRLAQVKRAALQKSIDDAEKQISELKDPTSLLNLIDWFATRGVRIFFVLLIMLGSRSVLRSLGSRAIRMMVHSREKMDKEDRNDRAETLVSVYSNAVSVSVIGGGLVIMAQEAGIPVGPLLGGVAIFGLAIAFGAQNLIKDYFYGFVVLLENQFSVNDVIQVGTITGLVERITLRMTVIRDGAGTVHFVPNGSMTTVSNFSYDWSRAVFEIPVSYHTPVDEVIQHIQNIGKGLRQDKEFGPLCLDDLTMLGVDNLSENSVTIKFFIKTRPLKQWPVKREMLRRLLNRFEEAGIDLQTTTRVRTMMVRADSGHEKSSHLEDRNREGIESFSSR